MQKVDSVALLIQDLQQKEAEAAQQLWDQYFHRLVSLARYRLEGLARTIADEEDVALSAIKSFCRGVEENRLATINNRDELWRALTAIVRQKIASHVRRSCRLKRDERRNQSLHASAESSSDPHVFDLVTRDPDATMVVEFTEELRRLLSLLETDRRREVVQLRLSGCTNKEIAAKFNCVETTVERELRIIRKRWERELAATDETSRDSSRGS